MNESINDKFTKYQHLEALVKPEMQNIFLQTEVVCTEKIHGTNARVGIIDGVVRIGGRNQDHTNDLQGDAVMGFVKWVRESGLEQRLLTQYASVNIIFYGEWFGSGIQKGINYGKEKQFRVFDVRLDGKMVDWDHVQLNATYIGLQTVPELYKGFPKLEVFDKLLDVQSTVAKELGVEAENNSHEGIVIKPTKMARNENTGDWLIAKYKSAKWSERTSEKEKKDFVPLPNEIHAFVDEFVTDTRLEHVLDHLRDQGIEVVSLEQTPHVLKEMNYDVLREGKDEIATLTADETVEWKQVSKLINNRTLTLLRAYLHKKLEQASQSSTKI